MVTQLYPDLQLYLFKLYDVYYRSLTNWAVKITRVEAFRRTSRTSEQQLLRFGVLHRPGHRLNHNGFS